MSRKNVRFSRGVARRPGAARRAARARAGAARWALVGAAVVLGLGIHWFGHERDRDCLSLALYHEARGEPARGQVAVGHVVLNRMRDPAFPGGACAVIRQGGEVRDRCQFSFYCDGRSDDTPDAEARDRAERMADAILEGQTEDPTGGALWYHAAFVHPRWSRSYALTRRIGKHLFYRRALPLAQR